jgi:hypothetical protein
MYCNCGKYNMESSTAGFTIHPLRLLIFLKKQNQLLESRKKIRLEEEQLWVKENKNRGGK